jgi:hypothetical protein
MEAVKARAADKIDSNSRSPQDALKAKGKP